MMSKTGRVSTRPHFVSVTLVALLAAGVAVPARAATDSAATGGDRASIVADLRADGAVVIEENARTGAVRFVGTEPGRPIARASGADADPEVEARGVLSEVGVLFGLHDQSRELLLEGEQDDGRGGAAVRFQQVHDGVPVLGGELLVHLDGGRNVSAINGEIEPNVALEVDPVVGAARAERTALDSVAKWHRVAVATTTATDPELWIYSPALMGGSDDGMPRLVWYTEVSGFDPEEFREVVLIDAALGSIALHFDELAHAKNRFVCDRGNVVNSDEGCVSGYARVEGGGTTGISDVDLAYQYAGDTYDFFAALGHDSLDDAGMALRSVVRFCPDVSHCPYQNAYWNGTNMVYGNGFAAADDVVGHELGHGVTDFSSHLFYYYQSGAINESLSDVFGELIDLGNGSGNDTAEVRWLLGEDVPGIGAIRDMENPPAFSDPDKMTSAFYTADANRLDNGGVHTNSGVNNKAAFLMTDGGSFNGQTVVGIGAAKVARIYLAADTEYLTSASDYADLASILPAACDALIGTGGISTGNCTQVRAAVAATEMALQPTSASAQANEAPLCAAGLVPVDQFHDDLENPGSGNWATSRLVGMSPAGWYYPQNPNPYSGWDPTYATSGVHNMWGNSPGSVSDVVSRTTQPVVPAAGRNTFLHFRHAYSFEFASTSRYDGGVVEYSVNGGASWVDAASKFSPAANGYNGTINGFGNPLAGRQAFSAESHGYVSSRINLTSLAGKSVLIRFRIGSDSSGGTMGWFVDDVRIYACRAPATAPGAPTRAKAVARSTNGATGPLRVSFRKAANNGSAITGYTARCTSANGGRTRSKAGTASPLTVTRLTTAKRYTCEVRATNSRGRGPWSAPSLAVIVGSPGAPTRVKAVKVASRSLRVSFRPGANNGRAITEFTARCESSNGGRTRSRSGTESRLTVSRLTAGKRYTCTARGANSRGAGLWSARSVVVRA